MIGAALSAFDDAAMLCVHESMLNDDSGTFISFLRFAGFW